MCYTKEAKSGFCTISESKRQDAATSWAYMDPILREIYRVHLSVDTVHFWSDGPSKQYKNKKNFILLSDIHWNWGLKGQHRTSFQLHMERVLQMDLEVKRAADSSVLRGQGQAVPWQFPTEIFCSPPRKCVKTFSTTSDRKGRRATIRPTSTGITAESIKTGDWMAVVYDEHWWLARAVSMDGENQDVRVEFLHPHGPSEKFTPQHCRRDEWLNWWEMHLLCVSVEQGKYIAFLQV